MGQHQADWGLKAALHENELHKAELDRLDGLVRESMGTCMAGTDFGGCSWPQRSQKRAKRARKSATKMGPHQADWGLKATLNESEHHKAELDRLDGLARENARTCMAGTDSGGCR